MDIGRLGRVARMLRVQRGLTQHALGTQAGVGRRAVSALERGRADELRLSVVRMILSTLGARLDLRVLWNGPELDRLMDEGHAALGAALKRRLEHWGWLVRVEVSFSHYGERGRIDLLAYHPTDRTLIVVELKTDLVDVQALLGSVDVKARLARTVPGRFGWQARHVVPTIVFLEDRTTRNRLGRVIGLFDRFDRRGRSAITWLRWRRPAPTPDGLLFFVTVPVPRRGLGSRSRVRASRRPAS